MKVFPLLCGHHHMPLRCRNKILASETVCESRFCVLSRKRILLLYSLKSFLRPVWHVWLPTDLHRKSLYSLQTESQSMAGSMNSFLKKWQVTCCDMMISLVQRLWNICQRDRSCFNFSLIYCELVDNGWPCH